MTIDLNSMFLLSYQILLIKCIDNAAQFVLAKTYIFVDLYYLGIVEYANTQ